MNSSNIHKDNVLNQLSDVLQIVEQVAGGDIELSEVQPALMEASDMLSEALVDIESYLGDQAADNA